MTDIKCRLCPRNCGADRQKSNGFCKSGALSSVARADLHMWEEPCISGDRGSGTVFFSGCSLRCVFCQNHEISHTPYGQELSDDALARVFLHLRDKGAHNINLVNPTHFAKNIINALRMVKKELGIPVVWNSGGYEKRETISSLCGLVDIFLPDLKYVSPSVSGKYSSAPDYFDYAKDALAEMFSLVGYPEFDADGIMTRGVLVRHLVLPSNVDETKKVIDYLAQNYDTEKLYVSLMCQYFPTHKAFDFPEISRRLTTLEYQKVLKYAAEKGIVNGFCQEKSSAKQEYVPQFFSKLDFS
ncbi:MAG: radical SAM protein [Ruminococcaceae bacterium]|nr:radical SAM protein [Oscillospiraceae bacterium]